MLCLSIYAVSVHVASQQLVYLLLTPAGGHSDTNSHDSVVILRTGLAS
jgi:hypothetical protein